MMNQSPSPKNPDQEQRLNAILAEYLKRRDAGQAVSQDAMLKAYPDLEDGLRSWFEGEALMDAGGPAFAATKLSPLPVPSESRETLRPGAVQSDTASEFTGRKFGRYQILRPLGEGAMGSVYLALDKTLDRQVALKVPKTEGTANAEFMARFTREAKAAAALKHQNICSVYDAGQHEGTAYITMDFIDGVPLSRFIGARKLQSVDSILQMITTIAEAVGHAHSKGVIHRDLKPGNILVDSELKPHVTDFGLARRFGGPGDESRITQEGLLIGTPAYMAPEQVKGEQAKVGPQSDVYSLGVILFELLTSRLPFEGKVAEMLAKVLRDNPPVPSRIRKDLSEDIDDICLKMLKKEPGQRYSSMAEVIAAIAKLPKKTTATAAVSAADAARSQSPFEIQKAHVELMLKKGQYAAAIQDLEKLAAEKSPGAKAVGEWARAKLPIARAESKALSPAGLSALLQTGQQLFAKSDYLGCIQLLDDVPSLRRTEAMEELLLKARKREADAEQLLSDIKDQERRQEIDGLEPLVKRFLKLKPGNSYAKRLWEALQTYSKTPGTRRTYRYEKGRLQAMPETNFLRQWTVLSVLVGLLVFLSVYAYVVVYLKSGNQTLAVHVDDEWLKSQGGELTLVVDGNDHTITAPSSGGEPLTVTVTLGEHTFSVKHGDTVVHDPKAFAIEKDGRKVLSITAIDIRLENGVPVPRPTSEAVASTNDKPAIVSEAKNLATDNVEWISLFDGTDVSRWSSLGPFAVKDGLLVASGGKANAVSRDEFADFELEAEWKIGQAANGGIYYREPASNEVATGNEYQIADDSITGNGDKIPSNKIPTGSLFGLITPPIPAVQSINEWNTTRIVGRGTSVEHWLNGKMLFRYNTTSSDWNALLDRAAVKSPNIKKQVGVRPSGHILLQAFVGELTFRSIRIRELASATETMPSSTVNLTDLDKIAVGQWKPLVTEKTVLPEPEKMSWKNGILTLDHAYFAFPEVMGRNTAIRAEISKKNSRGGGLGLRGPRSADFEGVEDAWNMYTVLYSDTDQQRQPPNRIAILRSGTQWKDLAGAFSEREFKSEEWISMAFVALENQLSVFVDGKKLIDVEDSAFYDGILVLNSRSGQAQYRNVEYQILDDLSESDLDNVATGAWKPLTVDKKNAHAPDKMSWKDGILRLEEQNYLTFPETTGSNIAVRAEIRKNNSRGGGFNVRRKQDTSVKPADGGVGMYSAWFEDSAQTTRNVCGMQKSGSPWVFLEEQKSSTFLEAGTFIPMAVVAIDDRIMLFINGKKEIDVKDSTYRDGYVAFDAWFGLAEFRNMEYQTLDSSPAKAAPPTATVTAEPGIAPFDSDSASKLQKAWSDHLKVPVEHINSVGMRFRLIPPGKFTMGSTDEQIAATKPRLNASQDEARPGRIESEGPPQVVTLTKPFYLGITEVTQLQYKTVVGANPSWYSPDGKGKDTVGNEDRSNAPVESVTWMNTGEFCNRLSLHEKLDSAYRISPDLITQTGSGGYRLPTEAEWEFACRAGSNTLFSSGDDDESLKAIAWFSGNNTSNKPNPVAQLRPNPFGLFDMHGNAWEQVHDAWRPDSYQRLTGAAAVDPRVDVGVESCRVVRGGSHWMSSAECRSACRDVVTEGSHWGATGFRVALSVDAVRQLQTNKDAGNDK